MQCLAEFVTYSVSFGAEASLRRIFLLLIDRGLCDWLFPIYDRCCCVEFAARIICFEPTALQVAIDVFSYGLKSLGTTSGRGFASGSIEIL